MKKVCVLLLAVCMALSLCSCSITDVFIQTVKEGLEEVSEETTEPAKGFAPAEFDEFFTLDDTAYKGSSYYTPVVCSASYDRLANDEEKELYHELLKSAYIVSDGTETEYNKFWNLFRCQQVVREGNILSEAQARTVVKAVCDDHPELFWVTVFFNYMVDEEENYYAVMLYSCYSPKDIKPWLELVHKAEKSFIESVPDGLSEYEREVFVHDFLLENCYYNESDANILEFYHSVYGVLVKGKAVCEGYAKAFQMLLNLLGVECVCIEGEGVSPGEEPDYEDDILHMWNAVKLEGEWYLADVTWDDSENADSPYLYLNGTDEMFHSTHIPSGLISQMAEEDITPQGSYWQVSMNIFVPDCTATEYCYIVREFAHLDSYYDTEDLVDAMTQAAQNGEENFIFYVDPAFSSVDDALDHLIYDYPQYIFGYLSTVNNRLSDSSINTQNVNFSYDEDLSIIIIIFEYT